MSKNSASAPINLTGEIDHHPKPNTSRRAKAKRVGGAILAGATLIGVTIYVSRYNLQQADKRHDAQQKKDEKLAVAMTADGFIVSSSKEDSSFRHGSAGEDVTLGLGSCSLSGVTYDIVKIGDEVNDVNNYSFSGVAYPRFYTESERVGLSNKSVDKVEGSVVAFVFDDLADLKENILGPEPCKTLAGQITHEISGE